MRRQAVWLVIGAARGDLRLHLPVPLEIAEGAGRRVDRMRAGATSVHNALRDAFVIEVGYLLAEDEVLKERRSAPPGFQPVLVVADRHAVVGGEHLLVTASLLVRLATGTVVRCAVAHRRLLAAITWIKAANE